MAITEANLKYYRCANWTENQSHGGAIDLANEIITDEMNNVFDDVTNSERIAGMVDYRKVFFRNENEDEYTNTRCWINTNTPALNTNIAVLAGGSRSRQGIDSDSLSGTFAFTNGSPTITATSNIRLECRPGEKIFNSTNDTNTNAVAIASISEDGLTITLSANYTGTSGSSKQAKIAPITSAIFVQPTSIDHANVLTLGNLNQGEAAAIWIKRTVTAGGDGYTNDQFILEISNY